MALNNAAGFRRFHQDISGELAVVAATDDTTLVTVRSTSHTIYIQKIIFYVTTSAAQSISFEDSNASAKQIFEIAASPLDNTEFSVDYGDEGVPLTEGKDFKMMVSAAGNAGMLKWYGYQRLTAAVAAGSTN